MGKRIFLYIMEIWKDVIGYEGLYQVSNLGNVKSVDRLRKRENRKDAFIKGKKLAIHKRGNYFKVGLCKNGLVNQLSIHRLIAINFIPNPENKPQVNHINGIKSDNRLDNLEWNTAKENSIHSFDLGMSKKGNDCSFSKLDNESVLKIKNDKESKYKYLAVKYNVSVSCITAIKTNRNWKHI